MQLKMAIAMAWAQCGDCRMADVKQWQSYLLEKCFVPGVQGACKGGLLPDQQACTCSSRSVKEPFANMALPWLHAWGRMAW